MIRDVSEGPELVVGLVGAIGADLTWVSESLRRQLTTAGYCSSEIRVSALLHDIAEYSSLADITDRERYYDEHMNKGNEVCERLRRADAMALLALLQLRTCREDTNSAAGRDVGGPAERHAYVLNSLKRPEEIRFLKKVYGDAFVLLGAYASRETRRDTLASRIAGSQNREADQCRHIAERLISRDESEATEYGQDVSHTFFRADAFIDATERPLAEGSIRRFVDVVFGHPFETPSRDELGMQHAFSSALRSADLSRQVGAAICSEDGQVIAVGTNEVPKAGGGFYWPGDSDYRDFRYAEADEPNAEMKRIILSDLLRRLDDEKLLATGLVLDAAMIDEIARRDRVKKSRLMNIIEFGRAVHAEMAAITDAARRGISVSGATLYCTTFPCHNCAKHVVAAGIRQVIYIEPYPKSEVARLFADSIALDRATREQVAFSSFVGFAPTRFADFFQARKRVDDAKRILNWDSIRMTAQPRISGIAAAYMTEEITQIEELKKRLPTAELHLKKGEQV